MTINRDFYLKQLINKKNNGLVKVITGIRRCGKSYLLDPMFKNYLLDNGVGESHIIKIDLDSYENKDLLNPDNLYNYIINKMIDSDKYYILLDEIQKVDEFEAILNSLLRKNTDIYVTGSNSKFLSSDVVTEFRGRSDEIRMYPLSFSEFYSIFEGSKEEALDKYLYFGGLPLAVLSYNDDKLKYLDNEKTRTYLRDVVDRNNIKNEIELEKLTKILSSSIGSLTNPLKLAKTFKSIDKDSTITNKTIDNYIKYMQNAFIIEKSLRYDIKGKSYIDTPYKIYFSDLGIRNSFLNYRQIEKTHSIENVIYNELRRRGYSVDVGVVEIRNNDDRIQTEIDFVCNKFDKKYYVQSSYTFNGQNKIQQELRPLLNTKDNFKKFVITSDNITSYVDENGIIILNLFEFLLNDNILETI